VLTQDFQDIWRTLQASAMPGTIFFVAFCSLHCVPLGVCVCVCASRPALHNVCVSVIDWSLDTVLMSKKQFRHQIWPCKVQTESCLIVRHFGVLTSIHLTLRYLKLVYYT